jgi:hypothetical protein
MKSVGDLGHYKIRDFANKRSCYIVKTVKCKMQEASADCRQTGQTRNTYGGYMKTEK